MTLAGVQAIGDIAVLRYLPGKRPASAVLVSGRTAA